MVAQEIALIKTVAPWVMTNDNIPYVMTGEQRPPPLQYQLTLGKF